MSNVPALTTGLMRIARSQLDQALGMALSRPPAPFDPEQDSPRRIVLHEGRVVSIPQGCHVTKQPYDLLIHFHGAAPVVEKTFAQSAMPGVAAVINWGVGSGLYERPLRGAGSFERLVRGLGAAVNKLCSGAASGPRRIALSGWSAGYGAVRAILNQAPEFAQVDAVLLADGLHTDVERNGGARRVDARAMLPFTQFADEASLGHKLFVVSHSAIPTSYASTTETTTFLLDTLGVRRIASMASGPRPGMQLTSYADRQDFHVRGFSGRDKQAHCDHLFAYGEIMLPFLRERWRGGLAAVSDSAR